MLRRLARRLRRGAEPGACRNPLGERGIEIMEWFFADAVLGSACRARTAGRRASTTRWPPGVSRTVGAVDPRPQHVRAPCAGRGRTTGWKGWWGDEPPYQRARVRAHASRARAARDEGRHGIPLRDRRHRCGARASKAAAGGRDVRLAAASPVREYFARMSTRRISLRRCSWLGRALFAGSTCALGYEVASSRASARCTRPAPSLIVAPRAVVAFMQRAVLLSSLVRAGVTHEFLLLCLMARVLAVLAVCCSAICCRPIVLAIPFASGAPDRGGLRAGVTLKGIAMGVDVVSPEKLASALSEHWSPRVIAEVDDALRQGREGAGHACWHSHDQEDESSTCSRARCDRDGGPHGRAPRGRRVRRSEGRAPQSLSPSTSASSC
jgi:hypothetical protein